MAGEAGEVFKEPTGGKRRLFRTNSLRNKQVHPMKHGSGGYWRLEQDLKLLFGQVSESLVQTPATPLPVNGPGEAACGGSKQVMAPVSGALTTL